MDALRRSSRILRKDKISNTIIRQQIGVEESIIKETEQKQLTWYGHVQRMAEERLPRIALRWILRAEESTRETEEKLDGRTKEGHERMNKRNLQEDHWEDRKQ
jgi:hypothetical protein